MNRLKWSFMMAIVFAIAAAVPAHAQQSTLDLMRSATYVFEGTVTRGAESGGLAVVRIDHIYWGAGTAGGAPGVEVRIAVRNAVKAGETWIFYAQVAAWRDLLELREIDRRPPQARDLVARDVANAAAQVADERIIAHLSEAAAVIEGKVIAVRAEQSDRPRALRSEHDPLWAPADIQVTRVLKGQVGPRVTVLFPTNDDVVWFRAPRLKVGQSGVFVLQRTAPRALPEVAAGVFYLVTYQDFYPPAEVPHIRTLMTRVGKEVIR